MVLRVCLNLYADNFFFLNNIQKKINIKYKILNNVFTIYTTNMV
jgi:hypothetical protein